MTVSPPQQDRFEERLLQHCREQIAERPASSRPGRPSAWRRVGFGAVAAGVAATGIAAATLLPHVETDRPATPPPSTIDAFTISAEQGGAIKVTWWLESEADAAALERRLGKYGITADVTFVPDGKICANELARFGRSAKQGSPSAPGREPMERLMPTPAPGQRPPHPAFLLYPSRFGANDVFAMEVRRDAGTTVGVLGIQGAPMPQCEIGDLSAGRDPAPSASPR